MCGGGEGVRKRRWEVQREKIEGVTSDSDRKISPTYCCSRSTWYCAPKGARSAFWILGEGEEGVNLVGWGGEQDTTRTREGCREGQRENQHSFTGSALIELIELGT